MNLNIYIGYDRDKSRSPERRWDDHGRHSRYPLDTDYSKRSESKDRSGKRYALDESDGDGERRRSHHSRHGYERGRSTSPLRVRPEKHSPCKLCIDVRRYVAHTTLSDRSPARTVLGHPL